MSLPKWEHWYSAPRLQLVSQIRKLIFIETLIIKHICTCTWEEIPSNNILIKRTVGSFENWSKLKTGRVSRNVRQSASRKPLTYHSTEGSLGNPKTLILETGSHKLKHTDSQGVPSKDPKRQVGHKNSLGWTSGCTKFSTPLCPGYASHTMGIPEVVGPSHSAFLLESFSRSPESPCKSSSSWPFTVLVWFPQLHCWGCLYFH